MLYLRDHRAQTIERVVAAVKGWRTANPLPGVQFELATRKRGRHAATNETVKAKELWILVGSSRR